MKYYIVEKEHYEAIENAVGLINEYVKGANELTDKMVHLLEIYKDVYGEKGGEK